MSDHEHQEHQEHHEHHEHHDHHETWVPGVGPVLDIGGDVGALILFTDAQYDAREIEISPVGDDARRTHTAIHERKLGERVVFAGVYPELAAGEYRLWPNDPSLPDRITIVGGEVAELDWRTGRD